MKSQRLLTLPILPQHVLRSHATISWVKILITGSQKLIIIDHTYRISLDRWVWILFKAENTHWIYAAVGMINKADTFAIYYFRKSEIHHNNSSNRKEGSGFRRESKYRQSTLWSSGQGSWLRIQRSGFDSRRYQVFWEVVGLEQGPLSLLSTTVELLGRNSSGSGLESREYTLHPQKLALT
jgi:hypothetical protein